MNAVIYARYSCDRQTEQSIEGQLRECKAFAASEGIQIIGEYIDRAISGTTANRPEFQRMIADSKYKTFQAVIVYKLDRFARNRYDSAMYKNKLKSNGVRVLSAKEHITDSPEGIILEGLLEAMNEYYSAELSQKIKRGMRENAIKGKTTGGNVALGYRIGADKMLEIDPAGAALVRRIFTSYDNGETFAQICKGLNDAGYTTSRGKRFRSDTISRILSNQRYTGTYQCTEEEAAHSPQIIEPSLFQSVQERLTESKHKHRHTQSPHEYVLTGKAICGSCGKRFAGRVGTSKTDKRYYYYCCPNKCCGWLPAAELEQTVLNAIAQYTTPEICDQIANATYALYQQSTRENTDLITAQQRLQETEKKLANAVNAVLNGLASTTLQATIQQLEQQKTALQTEIRLLQTEAPELNLEHFRYFAHRLLETQTEGTEKIVQLLVNQVIVYENQITVLVNLTDKTKTPPLEQVTAALRKSSCNISYGGGDESRTRVRKPIPATFYERSLSFQIPNKSRRQTGYNCS